MNGCNCRNRERWGGRAGAWTLMLALGLLAACAAEKKPPAGEKAMEPTRVTPKTVVAAQPGAPDLSRFFCLNAITPFHHKVSDDPAVRESLWATLDRQLALAASLGASHVRIDMWWGVIEPESGRFEWEFPDRVIDAIVKAGLEPFPILCYNAADSPDQSPATPEQREAYGTYVFQMVNRYKGKVRMWEVWNEPNIRPFWVPIPTAELYAELLKVAYTRAKEADPKCLIVAFCTAGADYQFIEGGYRYGAGGHLDAVSFHHYGDQRDESILESEILRIRRIMERNGDDDKPLLITELGLSTGPSPIASAISYEDQASWMVKRHMTALASGVSQLYWFKMKDDATELNPDGYWGVLRSDYAEKPSAGAYRTMAGLLSKASFVGRAWRITENAERSSDAEFLLFQTDGELFACAWVRNDGKPLSIRLPAATAVVVEDMRGNRVSEAKPVKDGYASIPLTREPRYLRGLSKEVVPLAATRFDPSPVYVYPGGSVTATLTITNPLDKTLSIDLQDLTHPPEKGGLRVEAPKGIVEAPGNKVTSVPVTISLPADAQRFKAQEYVYSDPMKYSYRLRVEYAEPFRVQMVARGEEKRGALTTYFTNLTGRTASGKVAWKLRGKDIARPQPFMDLKPGATASVERKLGPALNVAVFSGIVETESGIRASGDLRACGQPILEEAPVLDGSLVEWIKSPGIELTPSENQVRPEGKPLGDDEFRGTVRVAWMKDHLFVAADVVDDKPFVNPHTGTNIWRGDSMELYLGFGGPTLDQQYAEGQYHLGITPGPGGDKPVVWNWNPRPVGDQLPSADGAPVDDAKVVAVKTDKGYRMEAMIPLQSLGVTVEPYQFIGFDVSLNDLDDPSKESNEIVLIWNGKGMGWKDPSTWGFATLLPVE